VDLQEENEKIRDKIEALEGLMNQAKDDICVSTMD
jgi:hypothetical protein